MRQLQPTFTFPVAAPNSGRSNYDWSKAGSMVVSHCQTFLHSAAEMGLASPHSILGWERNALWFIGISLNQSQSSWAALSAGQSNAAAAKKSLEGTCFGGTCVRSKVVLVVQHKTQIGQIV